MSTVVFLGGGRITSAMLAGLRLRKTKHRLVVHDHNPGKLRDLKKRYGVAVEPQLNRAVEQADVLIVAVRPSSVRELLGAIEKLSSPSALQQMRPQQTPRRKTLAVSLAAGMPLHVLRELAGPPVQWARAMPSPLCRTGGERVYGPLLSPKPCARRIANASTICLRRLGMSSKFRRASSIYSP